MPAAFSPAPHVNVFGVHTEYGPLHEAKTWAPLQRVLAPVLGLAAGAAGLALAWIRRA